MGLSLRLLTEELNTLNRWARFVSQAHGLMRAQRFTIGAIEDVEDGSDVQDPRLSVEKIKNSKTRISRVLILRIKTMVVGLSTVRPWLSWF